MIQLISPSGTYSTLLSYRDNDNAAGGYFEWPFMSVMFWGEESPPYRNQWLTFLKTATRTAVEAVLVKALITVMLVLISAMLTHSSVSTHVHQDTLNVTDTAITQHYRTKSASLR